MAFPGPLHLLPGFAYTPPCTGGLPQPSQFPLLSRPSSGFGFYSLHSHVARTCLCLTPVYLRATEGQESCPSRPLGVPQQARQMFKEVMLPHDGASVPVGGTVSYLHFSHDHGGVGADPC